MINEEVIIVLAMMALLLSALLAAELPSPAADLLVIETEMEGKWLVMMGMWTWFWSK